MQADASEHAEVVDPLAPVIAFLRQHAPFDRMAAEHLAFLAQRGRVKSYAKGDVIIDASHGRADTLYVIKSGRVRGELDNGRSPTRDEVWELDPGECFPIGAMMARRPVVIRQRAVEDTQCIEFDRQTFEQLIGESEPFRDFCTQRIASLLTEALRGMKADIVLGSADASFDAPLGQLIRRAPVTCGADTPLHKAVERMRAERIGSIVVADAAGAPQGIFTLHDLLARVAAQNLALTTPVSAVMTKGVVSLPPHASSHDAMVTMARHGIGHLCIVQQDRLIGVLSERDLFALQRIGIVHLTRSIAQARNIASLDRLGRDIRQLVELMLAQGASMPQVTQIIALLNDHVTRRAIELCLETQAPAAPFAWLCFDGEGRQEQTLNTEQDNGILFFPRPEDDIEIVRASMLRFARRVNDALAECGHRLHAGGVRAGEAAYCLTPREWRARFDAWIDGSSDDFAAAGVFFDMRAVYGMTDALAQWQRELRERARTAPRFLAAMTRHALRNRPPLGVHREFEIEDGARAGIVDLRTRGAMPFVDAARVLALAEGIAETNTIARLRAAAACGAVEHAQAEAWCDAYAFVQLLRVRHDQARERAGRAPNHFIAADRLNDLDRRILKEAFRQARKLQSLIVSRFSSRRLSAGLNTTAAAGRGL